MTTLRETEDEAARRAIRAALAASNPPGNLRRAAEALGVGYSTLRKRIAALGLQKWIQQKYPYSVRQPVRTWRIP
jgi:DNA-binding NtrC family response regulator